jgi:L-2-hydroxyglutarate oxidase LhgO
MTVDVDCVVIGAGVIGLAVARTLALSGKQVLVIDQESRAGTQTSSRHSEVIHAGIYYPEGSLKAKLCVEGRDRLYDYCASRGVATKRLGKLIVATSLEEEDKLHTIQATALANGVKDLHWLSKSDVEALEPEINCTRALFSPSTGIVDSTAYMLALQGDAENASASFAFNTTCVKVIKNRNEFALTAADEQGDETQITCHHVINCAGHGAHHMAQNIEEYPKEKLPPRFLAKGSYCSLSGRAPFKHLIYPVPVSGALGIHATLDLAGAVRFGPDIQWVDKLTYDMPTNLPERFAEAVKSYWPNVHANKLTPSYCGIRPKIHGPEESFADFMIQTAKDHGVSGLINLFGIESPGLTSSLAVTDMVVNALESD